MKKETGGKIFDYRAFQWERILSFGEKATITAKRNIPEFYALKSRVLARAGYPRTRGEYVPVKVSDAGNGFCIFAPAETSGNYLVCKKLKDTRGLKGSASYVIHKGKGFYLGISHNSEHALELKDSHGTVIYIRESEQVELYKVEGGISRQKFPRPVQKAGDKLSHIESNIKEMKLLLEVLKIRFAKDHRVSS